MFVDASALFTDDPYVVSIRFKSGSHSELAGENSGVRPQSEDGNCLAPLTWLFLLMLNLDFFLCFLT